jgi:Glycosyl hydrolase family 71
MALMSFSSLFVALFPLLLFLRDVSSQAVFAHIVAGNSGSYSSQDWLNDINLAKSAGFDGFIMDIAPDTYNLQPMLDLTYAAAEQVSDFKIWLSFDYTGGFNTDGTPWHADQVSSLISDYSSSAAQYLWADGRPVVTTFEGCDNLDDWTTIKAETNCFFIPNYSCLGPAAAVSAPGVDGLAAWDDAAWPVGPTNITTAGDEGYLAVLDSKPYMMPVSPWFFRDVYGDNWLWRGDDLWFDRWNQVTQIKPDIVQVITWND